MRRWVLYLTLLVMAAVLGVQYYWALPARATDGLAEAIYSYAVPAVFLLLALWLGYKMMTYKNRDGLMVAGSFIIGVLLVAGLFTGFAHNGAGKYKTNEMALDDAKKAVQNAVNNWKGDVPTNSDGTINYHAMGFAGCPPVNEIKPGCTYQFKLGADKQVTFVNREAVSIPDPVLGTGNFSVMHLIGWLAFAVAMSANLFLLLESYVGVEMPVDMIYEEGVAAR